MKKFIFLFFLLASLMTVNAQRQMEKLDRGVVAINKGSGKLFISWRYFATDPENIGFNIYRQVGAGSPVKLNSTPVTNSTNYVWTVSGTSLTVASKISVKPVINGVEGAEEGSWNMAATTRAHRIVHDFDFHPVIENGNEITMTMKYCWPGDLNGDGKYDFVVDRLSYATDDDDAESDDDIVITTTTKIDAYNSDGAFMWRIDIGPNVITSSGHCDMVTTYDMDGDNCAEVLLAVSEGTTFPDGTVIKGDNGQVTDYTNVKGSAPQWVAIVNGKTGNMIDKVSLPHFDDIATERTDRWKHICGHFIIAYLDGIRPSLVYQYKNRQASGAFTGAYAAWHYAGGKLVQDWATRFLAPDGEFHQIRVGDVDGDGKDEVIEGGYAMDDDGTLLYYANIGHGDRHCLADIDPARPGLEHFFIQQSNIMGMGLFDAANGEMIKALYMSSVTDVGRGICGAFDPTRRGMQFYSTIKSYAMYDCKGKLIEDAYGAYPAEALWWGPKLSRWSINPIGGNKNPAFYKYNESTRRFDRDQPNFYNEDNGNGAYYMLLGTGGRAAFWGDLLGDWREEMIMVRAKNTGFCVVSTWEETDVRQYCLMQNPAYRGQTTARGYYQTADVDFYMAADMPLPPVPPVQTADVYVTSGSTLSGSVANGKSVMFDIRNTNNTITVNDNISATKLWLMNPKGKDYTFSGTGKFTGSMEIVKSMQGTVTLNGSHDYTGTTRISEGRLFVNGSLAGPVRIDARGVLGGNATVNGAITLEEGLNVEGGRIEPGNGAALGTITIAGNLALPGRNNLAFDIDQTKTDKNDKLVISGNLTVTGTNHTIVINPVTTPQTGTLTLATIAGTSNATADMFTVKGLEGTPYNLIVEANAIKIEIITSRAASNVEWKGSKSALWDLCKTENFLNAGNAAYFAVNDVVTFNDNAATTSITVKETMPVDGLVFTNTKDYTISGDGVISGTGGLTKTGTGKVSLLNEESTFTGGVYFSNGILEVTSLKNGGLPSSIGASSSDANNWIMQNATLQTAAPMATDRNMTVYGTLTVNNPTTNTGILLSGEIKRGGTDATTMILDGEGTLNLEGKTQFSKVIVKNGILSLSSLAANYNSFGSSCTVVLEGGKLNLKNVTSSVSNAESSFTIEVPEGAEAAFNPPGRWTWKGALTGKGTLNMNIPYVRLDMNGNWSAFEGTLNITGSEFRINNNNSYEKATINAGSGVSLTHLSSNRTVKVGGLEGHADSKVGGTNVTWEIGANGRNTTYEGVIGGTDCKLTKKGTGALTLTNSNTYTGGTDVMAGNLIVANTTGSATGTGAVTVRTGGMLSGTGIVSGNVTVYTASELDVFDGYDKQLTIGGNLTLLADSKTRVDVFPGGTTAGISVGGTVKIAGTLVIPMNLTEFAEGKSYKIFEAGAGKISGQFDDIESLLPTGLVWDQSRISEGIISIKKTTGINDVNAEGKIVQAVEYYSLTGLLVSENAQGAVIRKTIYKDGSFATAIVVNKCR